MRELQNPSLVFIRLIKYGRKPGMIQLLTETSTTGSLNVVYYIILTPPLPVAEKEIGKNLPPLELPYPRDLGIVTV